jgi:acyl-CoA dehydrogenase
LNNLSFELPQEVEETRKRARNFALREFTKELIEHFDETEEYPNEIRKKVFDAGFITIENPWNMLVTMEEFCRVDPGIGLSTLASVFGSEILLLYGTDEQKEKYLYPTLKGEKISAVAVTEPGAGSDVAGISSRIEKSEKGWILNGHKMFITNGTVADHYYLLARSAPPPSKEKRHHGLTLAIVERKWNGVNPVKLKGKLGMRATDTAEITFENVLVPNENIVGEEGKSFYIIMTFFNISRVYVAAQSVGTAQGILDLLLEYLAEKPASFREMEYVQFALAEISTLIEAARNITYKAAAKVFSFNPDPALTSMAKYYAAEVANQVANIAFKIVGIEASGSKLEKLYRDAKITEIWEGTSEIEKLVISRMILKKIQEVK